MWRPGGSLFRPHSAFKPRIGSNLFPGIARAGREASGAASMPLEILHGALVLFSGYARFEGAEIAALAGLRVQFSGIEPVFARLQLSDHGTGLFDTPISSNGGNVA